MSIASQKQTLLGFHYYSDSLHYRNSDLETWLPELQAMNCSWLTLVSPVERAIPEYFLNGLLEGGIEPILHFHLTPEGRHNARSLGLLFETYARWGARYAVLFDRPNSSSAWSAQSWSQADLVERFLDYFLPLAELAYRAGLKPVFPPLEPGGDYWDTAFLRAALRGLHRRGHAELISSMALGAYAWSSNRQLDWGAGGPERWPGARPYFTPPGAQDQRGFRIFDWYLPIAQAELGQPLPIMLLAAGNSIGDQADPARAPVDAKSHAEGCLALAGWLAGEQPELEPIPSQVLCCNYWLLAAEADSPHHRDAWFKADGSHLPTVEALRSWTAGRRAPQVPESKDVPQPEPDQTEAPAQLVRLKEEERQPHPIAHYLLMPLFEWGVNEWHLDVMRPFILQHHPTIGYSLAEACLAARVTVVGGVQAFPDTSLETLRQAGCAVERITADGTLIAS